jgi:RNA ligase
MHLARSLSYAELVEGLNGEIERGFVNMQASGDLQLFTYSRSCAYERAWNPVNELARGLILDVAAKAVVATPFAKFFNHGERADAIPDLPFETFEKIDGSLIIIYWHDREWRTATKGSFHSDQARAALAFLTRDTQAMLVRGTTYLAEYVGPSNRIVIAYPRHELVLLGAYREDGAEESRADLADTAYRLGWQIAPAHSYRSISDLLATAGSLPATSEGFVLRFSNGHRIKIKGDEYCRIHRLVSNVSPLAIYENMKAGDDLDAIRRELPEEFWGDFDQIRRLLSGRIAALVERTSAKAKALEGMSDKDVGLIMSTFDPDIRSFIFPFRKQGNLLVGRPRESLFKAIRPTANRLDGYEASSSMNRIFEEAA